jgi:hypothetical protein
MFGIAPEDSAARRTLLGSLISLGPFSNNETIHGRDVAGEFDGRISGG